MVANIGPGEQSGAGVRINNTPMTVLNGVAYFNGFDAAAGGELWRTDGTAAGTYRIADVRPGTESSEIFSFIVVGSRMYFNATTAQNSHELWSTDGTPGGTRRATAVPANIFQEAPTRPVVAGNALFFVADDGTHGSEVWRVSGDGTTGGMISDLNTMASLSNPNNTLGSEPSGLFAVGNEVVFGAMTMTGPSQLNAVIHYGLYRANATNNTLTLITETQRLESPTMRVSLPGGALFTLAGSSIMWRTDGTTAGTGPMTTVNVEYDGSPPTYDGNIAYFYGRRAGTSNYDMWRTDGTVAGTSVYALLNASGASGEIVVLNGRTYFGHSAPLDALDLWTSDGTPAGTHVVHDDGVAGIESGGVSTLIASAGRLYFVAFDTDGIPEPWVSDGTDAGTLRLADIAVKTLTNGSHPILLGSVGANVFFKADDGVHGLELWVTDGTGAGTRMLTNVQAANEVITPSFVVPIGNGVGLFELTDGAGTELWRTDGTAAGTWRVADTNPGPANGDPFHFGYVVMNGVFYFSGVDGVNGLALWRSDGTVAGTYPVINIAPDVHGTSMYVLPAVANSRVFIARGGNNPALLSSDGTAAGTIVVQSPVSPSAPNHTVTFQNRVCFTQYFDVTDSELYCSNGAAGSLTRITDFASQGLVAANPYVVNGTLIVDAIAPGVVGGGLYATDGTPGGMHKISDRRMDAEALPINGGTHYAWLSADNSGRDIFVTDGTQAGTHSVLTGAAPAHANVQELWGGFNDSIVFWVNDPDKGAVLWKANVDGSGARFLTDVDPAGIDLPQEWCNFLQNGTKLYFSASRVNIGNELWAITAGDPNSTDDYATAAFNTQVAIDVLANDADFDGNLNPGSIEIVTPPVSGTVAINAATGAINYTPNTGFSGGDVFVYRVADTGGRFSNPATVSVITLTSPVNTGPGTAPTPPPPSGGGSSGGGSSSGGGGGGGGALGLEVFMLLWLLAVRLGFRVRRHRA